MKSQEVPRMLKPSLIKDAVPPYCPHRFPPCGTAGAAIPNGILSPTPGTRHQAVALRIGAALLHHVEARKLGRVLPAPCDVVLAKKIVVQPDLLFIKRERRGLIGEKHLWGTPDLVIEILSHSAREKDLKAKRLYAHFEIPEYWAVDSDTGTAETLVWSELGYLSVGSYGKFDRLSSPLLPHLNLCLSRIFEPEDE